MFHLHREWVGRDPHEIARWRVDPMRNVRILDGSGEMRLQFEIKDERRLRALDMREVDRIELYVAVADSPPKIDSALKGGLRFGRDLLPVHRRAGRRPVQGPRRGAQARLLHRPGHSLELQCLERRVAQLDQPGARAVQVDGDPQRQAEGSSAQT